jgi:phosphoserine phosphatase RsbU/P
MPTLVVLGQPALGLRFSIKSHGTTVIGRDPTCDLMLKKATVSRVHAHLTGSHEKFFVEDAGSANGTFLNGRRITRKTLLHDGDRLEFHDIPAAFFLSDRLDDRADSTVLGKEAGFDEQRITPASLPVIPGPAATALKERLDSLIEIARNLGGSLDAGIILPRVLDLLFQMFPQAAIGEIHLSNGHGNLVPVAMKRGREGDSTDLTGAPFNAELMQQVFHTGERLIRTEDAGDQASVLEDTCQSVICVPVIGAEVETLGVILLETSDAAHLFDDDDLELVSAIGILAGQAISYAHAHQVVLRHQHIERQLKTARQIQLGTLPHRRPLTGGYRFAEYYLAAESVGGDHYFYDRLRDGRVIIGIADASGKGLTAAMTIVRFAGEVRLRIATSRSLKQAMSMLNRFVGRNSGDGMFITCLICILDPSRHEVTVANAGHLPPLVKRRSGNRVEELRTPDGSPPLGLDDQIQFHPFTFTLSPGDQVLLFTDGVTEAMNPSDQLYGIRRLRETLQSAAGDIQSAVTKVLEAIDQFKEGRTPSDDMTLVGFERQPLP